MRSVGLKWLLLADIHFKHQDLDRITKTAEWIASVAAQRRVHRVVVCGDLLTTRTSQPTHVLSACYRFLGSLVHEAQVPHVHVVLGNHDLAYRRDNLRATTALDALRLAAPAVQLHWDVGQHVWDGRRVLTLPFREDQSELTDAVAALRDEDAAETVAFAHLAVHRAITQRHVVRPSSDATSRRTGSVAYHGLIGPGYFSRLARTFTGHFHSHQSILQQPWSAFNSRGGRSDEVVEEAARLRGSVTYVGSPLQLTWADLWDEQRGVVLLDPQTLDHELIVNPHAVGYVTVGVEEVLGGEADPELIRSRHVMLLGDLTRFKYAAARDKLITLGARGIRSWSPIAPRFQGTVVAHGLGASTPASDASIQKPNLALENDMDQANERTSIDTFGQALQAHEPPQPEQLDLREQLTRYVDALDLDQSLEKSRELLVQIGQRLLEAAASEQAEEESQTLGGGEPQALDYKDITPPRNVDVTDPATAARVRPSSPSPTFRSPTVFNAQPRSLSITNFLGVQSTIHLDFGTDVKRGVTFLVGENGSGKSTLVEAIVWCQFGKCLRAGIGAGDVVNDKVKKDCSVRMVFDNGYAITRFRKHKEYGNRIIVERDGKVLPEFEKSDVRSTQAAIDELLGINYTTFVRTIVLGHESATSFLSSTPSQRRDLIMSVLGLEILDRCGTTTRRLLRRMGEDEAHLASRVAGLEQTMDHVQGRIMQLVQTKDKLQTELAHIDQERQEALKDVEETIGLGTKGDDDASVQSKRLDEQMSTTEQQDSERPEKHTGAMLRWVLTYLSRMHHIFQSIDAGLQSSSLPRWSPRMLWQRIAACSAKVSLEDVGERIAEQRRQLSRLEDLGAEQHITQKIATERDMSEQDVRDSLEKRKLHAAKQARLGELQAATRASCEKLAMIEEVIDTETAARENLKTECATLAKERASLAADRELLDFWASALAQKARRVSSSSSSSSATTSFYTFREFILEKSLKELNTAITHILTILFENSRHATALTTGMLRSLFVGDDEDNHETEKEGAGQNQNNAAGAVALDSSLSVDNRLSYGKRSGGERKRIDLALFFALLHVGHTRSPHRAHYMLVDEVFDSLDAAGQAAVVRWCDYMADARVAYIVVITHSEHLESGAGMAVLSAKMGADGVELDMDGRRVGGPLTL
ncbi:P-loop containing nucleoside triphosphate hydrolase protein [Cryphonectria parasitica EP155]|uniref:P-loop containing nucleoside triphosphate hydrolase protein n=1 Tax=Cryphonectria parasitica (strain ATCC 38755 / EP155) TaxID=660469 RepID=A0A9P5CMJ4_CRYP1|nr:P-loop containing nucleoside triphosphate hydrolase protein [Cryphonectria parasitica EP155]KAF3764163.1 P-loop containing nucleoside triphosphate hydrolase protein [Cryphonectria parasitica EP155]